MKKSTREIGSEGEKIVQEYLERIEWRILDTNWTKTIGEIDIIGFDGKQVVFIEVKYRNSQRGGAASENFTDAKKKKFRKTGMLWAYFKNIPETHYRYDFIAVQKMQTMWHLEHYKNIEV